jgi:cytochrome P450
VPGIERTSGDVAIVSLPSANRDADFIADPDVFV